MTVATPDVDETMSSRERRAAADVAVLERACELMRARGGSTLRRVDVHQAQNELGLVLTIRAK